MPDDASPERRKQSPWRTLILLAAVLIGVVIWLSLLDPIARVFFLDKPDEARWDTAQTSLAEITNALHRYAVEHNDTYPADLAPLTTTHFRNGVPKDPFTKEDFTYERTPTGFRLICLGKDQAKGGAEKPDRDIIFDESGER